MHEQTVSETVAVFGPLNEIGMAQSDAEQDHARQSRRSGENRG
jgi:hypothetical protein